MHSQKQTHNHRYAQEYIGNIWIKAITIVSLLWNYINAAIGFVCFPLFFFLFCVYCFMYDTAFKDLTKTNKKEHEKNWRLFLLTKSLEWRHVLTSMSANWNCRKVLSEWLISSAFFILQQKCVNFQVKIWYCHGRMERKGLPFQSVTT